MSDQVINNLERHVAIHELKLNSLLSITSAINSQASVAELLEIFDFTLKEQLNFRKFVFISNSEGWKIVHKAGLKGKIDLHPHLEHLHRIKKLTIVAESNSSLLKEFNIIIPVFHKEAPLSYLLLAEVPGSTNTSEQHHLGFAETLTNLISVAIENQRLNDVEVINRDLETASELQQLLFPSDLPSNRKMDISAKYISHQRIGGDYYDFIPLGDEEYIICIGDVSGKGISAALLMANFQATIRTLFRYQRFDLSFLIEELNKKVMSTAKGEKFITFFIAHYNAYTRKLKYINAGHNQPVLLMGKKYQLLHDGCIGLGMLDELPNVRVGKINIPPKSTLVLYTDGVVELEDPSGTAFGIERLIENVKSFSSLKMEDMNNILFSKLDEWRSDLAYGDDTAILSCKFF